MAFKGRARTTEATGATAVAFPKSMMESTSAPMRCPSERLVFDLRLHTPRHRFGVLPARGKESP